MSDKLAKEVSIAVKVPGEIMLPDPLGANYFHFTVVGSEVQFLVGSINLINLHEAKMRGEATVVVPEITHRFLLSPLGFHQLKSQIDQIAGLVGPAGVGLKAERE
ncbi:MAG TPA: hypothetical protein VJL28_00505 [Gemmatimonadaceae bacterium]|nr:hypothetical protein [Gemmatimonadaceae bacterium]